MKNEKILIFSYYSTVPGACQAEWIDDKIEGLIIGRKDVALISSIYGGKSKLKISHTRVPSISLADFLFEIKRARTERNLFHFLTLAFVPFALTFGAVIDLFFLFVTKGIGEGRWSWLISASLIGVLSILKFKPDKILSTGGPASAHLAGIILAKLFSLPIIVELQDPLSGESIGRNKEARTWLYKVEKYIIENVNKVVYVTNAAKRFAENEFKSSNISYIYPGSKDFGIRSNLNNRETQILRIVHLGSLYSTRNFDSIISAIDRMILKGEISAAEIELINLGHVSDDEKRKIKSKTYIKILQPVPRKEALEFASKCNILLLIQHIDNRSKVTIPYKTYDYLNLDNYILALLNSEELKKLISFYGHTAVDVSDVSKISQYLKDVRLKKIQRGKTISIDYINQALKLTDLI